MTNFKTLTSSKTGTLKTPAHEKIPGSSQTKNRAGGYTWNVDVWEQLNRFLILGTASGTYYVSKKTLTKENTNNLLQAISLDGAKVVQKIVEISTQGRAVSNDPAIFALAAASAIGSNYNRSLAFEAVNKVVRTGTDLFHFCEFRQMFGGWGRGMVRAVSNWYLDKTEDNLAYQLIKYRQRDGWSHRDVLRKAHPKPNHDWQDKLFNLVVNKYDGEGEYSPIVEGFLRAQSSDSPKYTAKIVQEYGLPREAVKTEHLNSPEVWEALLYAGEHGMPLGALVRNLNKLSSVGILKQFSNAEKFVVSKLTNKEILQRSRLHPIKAFLGLVNYRLGRNRNITWNVSGKVCDALDETFELTMPNVNPFGKPMMVAIDVSMSMNYEQYEGVPVASIAAAWATVFARTENVIFYKYNTRASNLDISKKQRIDDVERTIRENIGGGTNCASPVTKLYINNIKVEGIVVFTDNMNWYGTKHPAQAFAEYRRKINPNARLVTAAVASNANTINDPNDKGMLNICGFDTNVPSLTSDFLRGF